MGMFDSFLVTLKCQTCKSVALREIQTKEFANILANYHIGDIVEGAPIGEFWLKDSWGCENCRKKGQKYEHLIYIRLLDGLFINVYSESEYQKQREKALDTYEIMQLYRQSAYKGTNRGTLIKRIYGLIQGAKTSWKNNDKEQLNSILRVPKNSDELVNEILETIERYKQDEPELGDESLWIK
jgi:hypothetical protein